MLAETDNQSPDDFEEDSGAQFPESSEIGSDSNLEPMTVSLLGRLFAVPLLIVSLIVGCAVAIVVLFGGTASPEAQSVDSLLASLESSAGERSAGVLLPREKGLWQAALELAVRLEKKDKELTPEEVPVVAQRLSDMVQAELRFISGKSSSFGEIPKEQKELRFRRLEFLIAALGRVGIPEVVPTLIEIVRSGEEPFVRVAVQQLAELRALSEVSEGIRPMVDLLRSSPSVETKLMVITALSVLARPNDDGVIDALTTQLRANEGEVVWSAALSLARLGNDGGKFTLLDMLDRRFWETGDRYETRDADGVVHRYQMPAGRVDELLVASAQAVGNLESADLWEAVKQLESDPSPRVRGVASEVLASRAGKTGGIPGGE